MPMSVKNTAGGTNYANPFFGAVNHTDHVKVDVSVLTMNEVDVHGYLKPGVPFQRDGTLVSGASQIVWGVTPEAIPLGIVTPTTLTTLGAETGDPLVAVGTIGMVNRDIIEDNLARALTADELAAFTAAGCTVKLSTT